MLGTLLVGLGWLLLCPDQAWAWGPGTHVALGEAVL
ncbi:MAG TPA: phospholipase, partial [Gemmatimonadetes bacterium]|nr:phospholipase [Gemmatimonadota bacterium]